MQNRTDFDVKYIVENLQKHECLKDKVFPETDWVLIKFHKYFEISFGDDFCEFFNTHWHPNDNTEILEFIGDLVNEKYIFYHKYKFPFGQRIYKLKDLPRLIKTKNKKNRRVYSATKIYIDN